jgi:hypothetical protein
MQRPGRFFAWSLAVYALTAMFGETTGALMIVLVVDGAVGLLIIRNCMAARAGTVASPARRSRWTLALSQRASSGGAR